MFSSSEISALLSQYPRFEDTMLSLEYGPRMPGGIVDETREAVAVARKFNQEVGVPNSLAVDWKTHEDPGYIAYEMQEHGNRWGFYTMFIPKIFGGQGRTMPAAAYVGEELASVDAGFANVLMAHYLGYAGLISSCNVPLINRISREVVKGEKSGEPCTLALSITEPMAGTDVEEVELTERAKIVTRVEKVKGGYVFNGTKCFVTMGHPATWIALYGYTDPGRPAESIVGFMLNTRRTKGFSYGKHEAKMGQRAACASELVFEDCFIPDEFVLLDREKLAKYSNKPIKMLVQRVIDYIVCMSRPCIGSFGVGVARGAFEKALAFASDTVLDGRPLIDFSWVQSRLAEMYKNVLVGRLAYAEANWANSHRGIYNILQLKPLYYAQKYLPHAYFDHVLSPVLGLEASRWLFNKLFLDWHTLEADHVTSGWASLAKFAGTDIGVANCQMALEIMGHAGMRHDSGMEKLLRDAKLLQIYEGTNQLNRMNLFKCLIAPSVPHANVFDE